jgi:GH15 family glucan-1,4-alpha-glucosidase
MAARSLLPGLQSVMQNENKNPLRFWLGLTVGAAVGAGLYQAARYVQRVFSQPAFVSRAIFRSLGSMEKLEEAAYQIARDNLLAGIETRWLEDGSAKKVLVAGVRNFREPWARDFGFASHGLLALGEYQAVRECLEVFFHFQKANGQFPVKIHSTSIPNRYLHSLFRREQPIQDPLRPKYFSGHKTYSLDGNALLVIAALHYMRVTGDQDFVETHWRSIVKATRWLEGFALSRDGLLHQGAFSDWADSINRQGRVLYTNVLYWKALHDLAEASQQHGSPEEHRYFTAREAALSQAIEAYFWREDLGYYVTNTHFHNLSSGGNLMAIAWGLAGPGRAGRILDVMDEFGMAEPVPTRPVHRPYPTRFIALENRLGGIPHYHTEAAWLWLGAWHVVAAASTDRLEDARQLLDRMAAVIFEDGEVHEVYGTDGRFLSSIWYTSEAPLTWSAGMFVYAYRFLKDCLKGEESPLVAAAREGPQSS